MMASLDKHQSSKITKVLVIGDSKSGKTGSLVSLVKAGYKLRIIDLDNGLDPLVAYCRKECPDKMKNVEYEIRRDRYKASASGPIIAGQPRAFRDTMKLMNEWSDGTTANLETIKVEEDGITIDVPDYESAQWGSEYILVLDSLTALGRAAFEWAKGMNPTIKDPRQWFYSAQRACEDVIASLTSDAFYTNVIVISHISYIELADGTTKGYPSAIGKELSKHVAKYFNNLVICQSSGTGKDVKRRFHTVPTAMIDAATSAPFKMETQYDISDGMAKIFETLRSTE